jgi:hypothetical protein
MAPQPLDYARLAREHGGSKVTPPPSVDYAALAREVSESEPAGPDLATQWRAAQTPAERAAMLRETPTGQSLHTVADVGIGFAKGVAERIAYLGELVHKVPGVSEAIDAFYGTPGLSRAAFHEAQAMAAPTSTAQHVGKVAEQIAEVFVPAGKVAQATKLWSLPARVAAEAGLGAGVAVAQKGDPVTGAVTGAAGPVLGAAGGKAAEWIGSKAVPLVRAGLKTPLGILKQQPGVATEGLDFAATRLAKFIIDNRIATVGQATRILKNAEADIQQVLAQNPGAVTDAPSRVMQYLDVFKRRAAKSLSPDQAKAVAAYADELLQESPLGETVTQTVMRPPAMGSLMAGQTASVPTPVTTRALRPDVPAQEALEMARETSRFRTGRQWGEQKGVVMEATKTAERAVRDAVKDALPEIRTPLQREGMAILAKQVIDRRALMEANRDVVSLPGLVGLNVNAVVGFAAHWLRNNQRQAGIWADQLSKAVARGDAATTAAILHRLGLGAAIQATTASAPLPVQP